MRKRDRMHEKWEEMKAENKAWQGVGIIAIMCMFALFSCVGNSDAKSYSSSSKSSSRPSVSRPAPKVKAPSPRVQAPAPKMNLAKQQKAPAINLSKQQAPKVVKATPVVNKTAPKAVVKKTPLAVNKTIKYPFKTTGPYKRKLGYGMYERSGYVCKVNRYGVERCKTKLAYFYDDVLDADDWFEHDDNYYRQPANNVYMPPQQVVVRQSGGGGFFSLFSTLMIIGALGTVAVIIILVLKRK